MPPMSIAVATDDDLSQTAVMIGVPFYRAEWRGIWDFCMSGEADGLVLLRNLVHPNLGSSVLALEEFLAEELVLVNMLSLMSDMWDIPFFAVVWGGPQVMPTSQSGVIWAMIEDAVRARQSRVVRVNGLFGPSIQNEIWNALESDKPTLDNKMRISPISDLQLVDEAKAFFAGDRRIPGLLGYGSLTWYQAASTILTNVRPFYRGNGGFGALDASWASGSHEVTVVPVAAKRYDWRREFALMAKDRGHTIQRAAREVLFA